MTRSGVMFDAFIACGLSGSSPLVSLQGEEGLQSCPTARYRPSLLDAVQRVHLDAAEGVKIPQHFPTASSSRAEFIHLDILLTRQTEFGSDGSRF